MTTKNTLIIAALTGLLLSGPALYTQAQDTQVATEKSAASEKLSIAQVKPMQFRVSYINPVSKNVVVRILDADKNVLFSENKQVESKYLKYFDLSTLNDGVYTFEILDGKDKALQSFDVLTKTSRTVSYNN